MKTVNIIAHTREWHAHRATHWNASDAPAMMGCGQETRTELLHRLHIGIGRTFSDYVQERVIDPGHQFEALARPLAEGIVGDVLYPVVGVLEGTRYSASFDGITLMEDVPWEHKRLNAELRAAIRQQGGNANDFLPLMYRVQLEQQCMVAGADRALFMASEWDGDRLVEERHCWYTPDAELRAQIIAGWQQFAADLAAYVPTAAPEPAPVGKAPETLPALLINVTGAVTASNLPEFKATALAAIRSVNRDLKTDADFADADKAVKWCGEVESRLKAAKEHALSQTASIDALFKALGDISAEAKTVRLDLGKLIDRRKVERKEEAVTAARRELDTHITGLNAELAPMALRPVQVDFGGAIKGLRSFASMDDALRTAVANGKIAADAQAKGIRANVAVFKAATGANGSLHALFADLHAIVHKPADDFATLVDSRIGAHRAAEAAKEAKRQADEAKRIADAEARAREEAAAAERQRIEAERRAEREAQQRREREAAEADRLRIQAEERAEAAAAVGVVAAPAQYPPAVAAELTPTARAAERVGALIAGHVAQAATMHPHAVTPTTQPTERPTPEDDPFAELLAHLHAGIDNDRFPSHPKPSRGWWDELKALMAAVEVSA